MRIGHSKHIALFFLVILGFKAQASVRFKEVVYRHEDLGGSSPDALERVKRLNQSLFLRRTQDYELLTQERVSFIRSAVASSWQMTPSLWMALGVAKEEKKRQSTEILYALKPTAAFKIMDTLILAYRLLADFYDKAPSHLPQEFGHHGAIRWRSSWWELSYDYAQSFVAKNPKKMMGIEARWLPVRNYAFRARFAREKGPIDGLEGQQQAFMQAVGGMAQWGAATFMTEYEHKSIFEEKSYEQSLAMTLDYEYLSGWALGAGAKRINKSFKDKTDPLGSELILRISWYRDDKL